MSILEGQDGKSWPFGGGNRRNWSAREASFLHSSSSKARGWRGTPTPPLAPAVGLCPSRDYPDSPPPHPRLGPVGGLEDCSREGEAVRGGGARAASQEQVSASCLNLLWSHVSPHSQV